MDRPTLAPAVAPLEARAATLGGAPAVTQEIAAKMLETANQADPRSARSVGTVGEASIGRGDEAFEHGDFSTAFGYYARVEASSRVYRYALYKTGWAHENLGEVDAAIAVFTRAADGGDPKDPLVRESPKELAKLRPETR